MQPGHLAFILHAHMPFVRHPEYDDFLEERWLFEVITESYIPLLHTLDSLVEDKIDFRLTISLSPTVITMLDDPLLKKRYLEYLSKLLKLADREVERTRDTEFYPLSLMYQQKFAEIQKIYLEKYHADLIAAFRRLRDSGKLELLTCSATHAYLPLLEMYPSAIKAQIIIARDYHLKMFGQPAEGIWLPECGYYPGLDKILRQANIKYFIVEAHGIVNTIPPPKNGPYAPVRCPESVIAFARDSQSCCQVWSATTGYSSDTDYREFYRDIGFDLDRKFLYPFLQKDGIRTATGFKYYRITGKTEGKQIYQPSVALQKVKMHAQDFLKCCSQQLQYLASQMEKPIVVVAFDAELLGHWWFEGPQWLNHILREIPNFSESLKLTHLKEYLENCPALELVQPSLSSWGYKGYSETWLNPRNDWIYPHLHKATERIIELAQIYPVTHGVRKRALNQAVRELLLAQSSDWAFIIHNQTAVGYARKRIMDHLGRFNQLYQQIRTNCLDVPWLEYLEYQDNIFPDLDYRVYADHKSAEPNEN